MESNIILVMDIISQSGTNAIFITNEAQSCYDRIILMVAYLNIRNFGIPARTLAKSAISYMKHFI